MRRKIVHEAKPSKPELTPKEQRIQDFKKTHKFFSILAIFLMGYILFFEMDFKPSKEAQDKKIQAEQNTKLIIESPENELLDALVFTEPARINKRMERYDSIFKAYGTNEIASITEGGGKGLPKNCGDLANIKLTIYRADTGRFIYTSGKRSFLVSVAEQLYFPALHQLLYGMRENEIKWAYIPTSKSIKEPIEDIPAMPDVPLIVRVYVEDLRLTDEQRGEFTKQNSSNVKLDVELAKSLGCKTWQAQQPIVKP
jgi:hypothetical protein